MNTILCADAPERLEARRPILKRGDWGDGVEAVCLMSALVPGATSMEDCVTAGWPEWLPGLVVTLYDETVGAEDEQAAADIWAFRIAEAIRGPVDYERARDRFLVATLETVLEHDRAGVVQPVIDLLHRRLARQDAGAAAWEAAREAAREAAWAAAWATAGAAAWAAAWEAAGAAARAAAGEAAGAAAKAAAGEAAKAAAWAAAWAAARERLLGVLK